MGVCEAVDIVTDRVSPSCAGLCWAHGGGSGGTTALAASQKRPAASPCHTSSPGWCELGATRPGNFRRGFGSRRDMHLTATHEAGQGEVICTAGGKAKSPVPEVKFDP